MLPKATNPVPIQKYSEITAFPSFSLPKFEFMILFWNCRSKWGNGLTLTTNRPSHPLKLICFPYNSYYPSENPFSLQNKDVTAARVSILCFHRKQKEEMEKSLKEAGNLDERMKSFVGKLGVHTIDSFQVIPPHILIIICLGAGKRHNYCLYYQKRPPFWPRRKILPHPFN